MNQPFKILLVEDIDSFREVVRNTLSVYNDISEASSLAEARAILKKESFEVAILDKGLPDGDGLELIAEIKTSHPNTVVIVLTSDSDFVSVRQCILRGADDYVVKSTNVACDLLVRVPMVVSKAASHRKLDRLQDLVREAWRYEILGKSKSTLDLRESILSLKGSNAHVLITGESGTGKELVARRINSIEDEEDRPFVALNCGAIAENLVESELFGHTKGSFSGATQDRIGKFEQASGGDLFLDELGEMPLASQAKLLRAIQEGEITRVGDNRIIKVKVRIVAATNRSLPEMIQAGTFREDLFHRLNVVQLQTTPLRHRIEDIPDLARMFVLQIGGANFKIGDRATRTLQDYDWPGNIRELRNSVERAVLAAKRRRSSEITEEDLVIQKSFGQPFQGARRLNVAFPEFLTDLTPEGYRSFLEIAEREYLKMALYLNSESVAETASKIGLSRSWLHKRLLALGISREDKRKSNRITNVGQGGVQLQLGRNHGDMN